MTVQHVSGKLTDHYDPRNKTLNLSDSVYSSASVAAVGVAAHECGHAIQHQKHYAPLTIRSAIVPVANFGSTLGVAVDYPWIDFWRRELSDKPGNYLFLLCGAVPACDASGGVQRVEESREYSGRNPESWGRRNWGIRKRCFARRLTPMWQARRLQFCRCSV